MEKDLVLDLSGKNHWKNHLLIELNKKLSLNVRRMDLSNNQIDITCAEFLANFLRKKGCSLLSLCLNQTKMNEKSCSIIFKSIGESNLIELLADDNIITEESCKILVENINTYSKIRFLSLSGCDIQTQACITLAPLLSTAPSIQHIRLDSNSIFDDGVKALGDQISHSTIISVSISDNQIWNPAMSYFLNKCTACDTISSLDLSYNCVDLTVLANCIKTCKNLSSLAISGCKVDEKHIPVLFEALNKSSLSCFIVDGLDYNAIPASWPPIKDTVFSNPEYFYLLVSFINQCNTLIDLRLGFLDIDQIILLSEIEWDRKLTISLHDFGRTKQCWLLRMPNLVIESPSAIFRWENPLNPQNSMFLGKLFGSSTYNGNNLSALSLSSLKINDDVLHSLTDGFCKVVLDEIDFSSNEINNIEHIISLINKTTPSSINLSGNPISESSFSAFMNYISENPDICPNKLSIGFYSQETLDDILFHPCTASIANLLVSNHNIEYLTIFGSITCTDVISFIESIRRNNKLLSLTIESDHIRQYMEPDPNVLPAEPYFVELALKLESIFTDKESNNYLIALAYPLLFEIFVYHPQIIVSLEKVNEKLRINETAQNRKKKRK